MCEIQNDGVLFVTNVRAQGCLSSDFPVETLVITY